MAISVEIPETRYRQILADGIGGAYEVLVHDDPSQDDGRLFDHSGAAKWLIAGSEAVIGPVSEILTEGGEWAGLGRNGILHIEDSPSFIYEVGQPAVGLEGATWSGFGHVVVSPSGLVAFQATIEGGGELDGKWGLWVELKAGEPPGLVAIIGRPFEIAPLDIRRVTEINVVEGHLPFLRAMNDSGELAFQLTFEDGTAGVFVTQREPYVAPGADLGVEVTHEQDPETGSATVTATVTNHGPRDSEGAALTFQAFDEALRLVSVPPGCQIDAESPPRASCTLQDVGAGLDTYLVSGQRAALPFRIEATEAGLFTFEATLSEQRPRDSDPSNDGHMAQLEFVPWVDLVLTLNRQAYDGCTFDSSLVLTNNGTAPSGPVVLVAQWKSWYDNTYRTYETVRLFTCDERFDKEDYTITDHELRCDVATIDAGEDVHFAFAVDKSYRIEYELSATSDAGDHDTADNAVSGELATQECQMGVIGEEDGCGSCNDCELSGPRQRSSPLGAILVVVAGLLLHRRRRPRRR